MNIWIEILVAVPIAIIVVGIFLWMKRVSENPKIKGILNIISFDKNSFSINGLAASVKPSLKKYDIDELLEDKFFPTISKKISLKGAEVVKLPVDIKGMKNGSVPVVIEVLDHVIYAYVLGPNSSVPRRINGWDICFGINSKSIKELD